MVILIPVVLSGARKHSEFWMIPGQFRSSGAADLRRNDGRAGSFRSCDENVRLTHSACRLWTIIGGDRDAGNHPLSGAAWGRSAAGATGAATSIAPRKEYASP